MRYGASIAATLAIAIVGIGLSSSAQIVPEDNLSYPVLILVPRPNGTVATGSGFYMRSTGHTYLVTARHVLFEVPANTSPVDMRLKGTTGRLISHRVSRTDEEPTELEVSFLTLHSNKCLRPHLTRDVAVLKVAEHLSTNRSRVLPGVKVIKAGSRGIIGVPKSRAKKFDEVPVSEGVFIFGYPTSLATPTKGVKVSQSLLRKGIISGKSFDGKLLFSDCAVYQGNSGGLVLLAEKSTFDMVMYYPVGVAVRMLAFQETMVSSQYGYTNINVANSGYSVIEPMDFVLELVD